MHRTRRADCTHQSSTLPPMKFKHLYHHDAGVRTSASQESVSSVCNQEVTAWFTSASVANCLSTRWFLRVLKGCEIIGASSVLPHLQWLYCDTKRLQCFTLAVWRHERCPCAHLHEEICDWECYFTSDELMPCFYNFILFECSTLHNYGGSCSLVLPVPLYVWCTQSLGRWTHPLFVWLVFCTTQIKVLQFLPILLIRQVHYRVHNSWS
jgi:hypothetical protein